jgi:plastocyanin
VCFVIFANTAFADIPIEMPWPSQTIKFTNLSSLNSHTIHLYDLSLEEVYHVKFNSDTTCFFPAHEGPRRNSVVFFALLLNESTDTIFLNKREGNTEIQFTGIKNNKLQFIKKKLKVDKGFTGAFTNTDKEGFNDTESGFWKTDKLLYGLSLTALIGLMMYYIFFKRENNRPYSNPVV